MSDPVQITLRRVSPQPGPMACVFFEQDQSSWLCQGGIEEDGDALIVEGFRFESAASTEELRSLGSQPGPSNL